MAFAWAFLLHLRNCLLKNYFYASSVLDNGDVFYVKRKWVVKEMRLNFILQHISQLPIHIFVSHLHQLERKSSFLPTMATLGNISSGLSSGIV